jgi:hypothetical protein
LGWLDRLEAKERDAFERYDQVTELGPDDDRDADYLDDEETRTS